MKYPVLLFSIVALLLSLQVGAKTKPRIMVAVHAVAATNKVPDWKGNGLLEAKVAKGELYIFQVDLLTVNQELRDVQITVKDNLVAKGKMGILSKSFFRFADDEKALQEEGRKLEPFTLMADQPRKVYAAVKIPAYISPTTFQGKLNIEIAGKVYKTVDIQLHVSPNRITHTRFSEQ